MRIQLNLLPIINTHLERLAWKQGDGVENVKNNDHRCCERRGVGRPEVEVELLVKEQWGTCKA